MIALRKSKRKLTISSLLIVSVVVVFLIIGFTSCKVSYLAQAMAGHLRIMNSRQAIEKVLKKGELSSDKRAKLQLVLDIHDFAINELSLPENKSYTVYAEIEGEYPGWNIYCAPKLSMTPKTWCFPIAGCVVYHGYFKKVKALKFAQEMEVEGYDVYMSPFTAYSTLGWYKDPILSTHLEYDSTRLAGLIIHEMAHQRFYVSSNSQVSESFAVTVERAGVIRWLESLGKEDQIEKVRARWKSNERYFDKMLDVRKTLEQLYQSDQDSTSMLEHKTRILKNAEDEIFGGKRKLNNAHFIPISTYNSLVPEFQAILDSCGGNFSMFYEKMEAMTF